MKKIIIITTINLPLNLYGFKKINKKDEWDFLVVGDLKTEHEAVKNICKDVGGLYLSPSDQTKLGFTHSTAIGWNCIERKNIGYLFALKENYDLIGSLDDDNYPTEDWFNTIQLGKQKIEVITSDNGWYNTSEGADTQYKLRGFPISKFHEKPKIRIEKREVNIGIQAGLVLGDPDVDAVSRIVNKPNVNSYKKLNFCLAEGTMCPYNTQNTIITRKLLPANMMWGSCGRYDDIFASYVGQKIAWKYNYLVKHGNPLAMQDRNQHNLILDLEQELLGMKIQEQFFKALNEFKLIGESPLADLKNLVYFLLNKIPLLPHNLRTQIDTWEYDINTILNKKKQYD